MHPHRARTTDDARQRYGGDGRPSPGGTQREQREKKVWRRYFIVGIAVVALLSSASSARQKDVVVCMAAQASVW
jgi:hypothetical protein